MLGYKKVEIKGLGKIFFYNELLINKLKKELALFLRDKFYMDKRPFAQNMIISLEIKTNNAIEGDIDGFTSITKALSHMDRTNEKERRIINLYKGYQYILNNPKITKESLRELYQILSNGLLDDYSKENMGDYYRKRNVYILRSSMFLDCDKTVAVSKIDEVMTQLLNYINSSDSLDEVDIFIKSQIIHFLFVYIHPYFDVNGRCSRTLAMWYLLNCDAYSYVIFNRGISLTKKEYIEKIRKSRSGNLTPFLAYILKTVHLELEKEYVITDLISDISSITASQLEMLEFILSINDPTLDRLYSLYLFYNRYISEEKFKSEKIKPLIELGIVNIDKLSGRLSIKKEALKMPIAEVKKLKYLKIG